MCLVLVSPRLGRGESELKGKTFLELVTRDRMAAAGKMLTAILSHAADQSGLKTDCERIAPA